MEKKVHIEGFLFIPPNLLIKNPEIKITPEGVLFQEGPSTGFTHRGIALPCLVNCHAHLDINTPLYARDLVSWIKKIILSPSKTRGISHSIKGKLQNMLSGGICLTLDITREIPHPLTETHLVVPFAEITQSHNQHLPPLPPEHMVSPHAIYSTSEALLRKIASRYPHQLKAIHTAESNEEILFIQGKPNRIEDEIYPLIGRKRKVGIYESPVVYLKEVGLLSDGTMLVHCCFISEKDAKLIESAQSTVCICPRSNLYLSGKTAPVRKLMEMGVNLVLGTDSCGSSPSLNLWEEAQTLFLTEKIPPQQILAMASTNAYRFLKRGISHLMLTEVDASHPSPEEIAFQVLFKGEKGVKEIIPLF